MLKSLAIQNFAIMDDISLSFSRGLNVFSGETGAGKSIIIEALGFALGARGDSGLIKDGTDKMTVSAEFDAQNIPANILAQYDVKTDIVTLKRELDNKGKNRAWINGKTVAVSALAEMGDFLVDFHGQHDHQTLLKPSLHMEMLDSYAKTQKELSATAQLYKKTQDIKAKIEALHLSAVEKNRLLDLYTLQYNEISKAALKPGEDIEIETTLPKLKHAGKLQELGQDAYNILYEGDNPVTDSLSKASRMIAEMAELDESLSPVRQEVEAALRAVEENAQTIYNYYQHLDIDPQALDDMLAREQLISKLKLKYGATIEEILQNADNLKTQIENLSSTEEKEQELVQELQKTTKELLAECEILHDKRFTAAQKLDKLITAQIKPLGFSEVRFKTDIIFDEGQANAKGADQIEFLFSPNPGQSVKPLKNIASGGEMSRVMLGLKTVLAGSVPVMVFDEIDAGIGGTTGTLVGEKLKQVATGRQALCVTHLAQVAVFADKHFNVTKTSDKKSTSVLLTVLENGAKTKEIARMLGSSGDENSAGFKHAQELLQAAGK
ncbi:DNA repair protein RecN (Recombination protein N) [Elusimicrobium posterum]|uniref:DNA repair protein RecN n=1 Tax=Elusimicrobium posterum TaxID=3116653 RepID=UPI003C78151B